MKHASDCQCDVCIVSDSSFIEYDRGLGIRQALDKRRKDIEKFRKAIKLIKFLEIPLSEIQSDDYYFKNHINASELYDILMDEEKLRILVSKLKLKAFW